MNETFNFQEELIKIIKLVNLDDPKNVIYLSPEGKLYIEHHIKNLFLKNHKTLNFSLELDEMVFAGTDMLEDGECVIFDRDGKPHSMIFEDYEKHIKNRHFN